MPELMEDHACHMYLSTYDIVGEVTSVGLPSYMGKIKDNVRVELNDRAPLAHRHLCLRMMSSASTSRPAARASW